MIVQAPRPRVRPSPALGVAGFCTSISWQLVVPILPLYLAQLGYTAAAIGVLAGLFSVAMAVTELQAGALTAAIGRRRALLGGYVANAVCLGLVAAAHTRLFVAGSLAAAGAARGVVVPPLHATVADSAGAEARGRAFGAFWLWSSLAALSGPAIGGFVAARHGFRAPFGLAGLSSLTALLIVAVFARPAARPAPAGEMPAPGPAAAKTRTPGSRPAEEDRPAGPTAGSLTALLSDPSVARLGICILLCYSLAGIWTTFLPLYAAHRGVPVETIGLIFALQGGMYAAMQLPTGRLITVERGRWMVPAGIAGIAGVVVAVPFAHAAPPLLAAGVLYGAAIGLMPVTFATLVTWRVPADRFTAAMSIYNAAIDFGLFAGPLLGAAAARLDVAAPFLLALPLGLVAIVISLRTAHGVAATAPDGPIPAAGGAPGAQWVTSNRRCERYK